MIRPLSLVLLLAGCASAGPAPAPADAERYGPPELQADAARLAPGVASPWVRRFLEATAELPPIAPRTIWRSADKSLALTAEERAALPEAERAALGAEVLDQTYYYATRYGSPLAYTRPLEILAQHGFDPIEGKRILDFGYGTIGHLRLLATIGADVTGVEVDPVLRALYSAPGDQGPVGKGRLKVAHGNWPAGEEVRGAVGGAFDLILSKNVLKRGYIHPEQPVDPKKLVHLGVDDAGFLAAVQASLQPGGLFLIYNICPPPNEPGKPYIPWADGRSPFSREAYDAAGLEVLAYDASDTEPMRAMGRLLGWGPDGETYVASYTLVRKR